MPAPSASPSASTDDDDGLDPDAALAEPHRVLTVPASIYDDVSRVAHVLERRRLRELEREQRADRDRGRG